MIRIEPIDYPQLYAQAVSALREGERYWFYPGRGGAFEPE